MGSGGGRECRYIWDERLGICVEWFWVCPSVGRRTGSISMGHSDLCACDCAIQMGSKLRGRILSEQKSA